MYAALKSLFGSFKCTIVVFWSVQCISLKYADFIPVKHGNYICNCFVKGIYLKNEIYKLSYLHIKYLTLHTTLV